MKKLILETPTDTILAERADPKEGIIVKRKLDGQPIGFVVRDDQLNPFHIVCFNGDKSLRSSSLIDLVANLSHLNFYQL